MRNAFTKYLKNVEDSKPTSQQKKRKKASKNSRKKSVDDRFRLSNWLKDAIRKKLRIVRENKVETTIIVGLLLFSGILHAWNMFHFPYFENDEATYLSRGWSFVTEGRLDPYTYRYEHAPFGWILMGIWLLFTGGDLLFSSFLVSGRVMMLVLQLISAILVYKIGKSLFDRYVGILASILFSISPLAIYFHRRVLLDNVLTVLLLGSVYLIVRKKVTLRGILLSAILFALAILTKLNAALCFPALAYLVWHRTDKALRRHAIIQWIGLVTLTSLSYVLLAQLKGELLPAPLNDLGEPSRVSLIDSLRLQSERGDFTWFWDTQGSFIQNVFSWARKDLIMVILGGASIVLSSFLALRDHSFRVLVLLSISLLAFLLRGKIVIDLYIVPLIPFIALMSSACILSARRFLRPQIIRQGFALLAMLLVIASYIIFLPQRELWKEETNNQLSALKWIEQNVEKKSNIVIDNFAYMQLTNSKGYENADYMFMVEYDPQIRRTVLKNDWRNIDYILLTHEMVVQMGNGSIPFVKSAFLHSELMADYRIGSSSFIDIKNLKSTNGDWAQVYKVKNRAEIVLQQSWEHFRKRYFVDYGQIIDPTQNDLTTSGLLSAALIRAVQQNDKDSFNGIYQWSNDHLRYRQTDRLLSWRWEKQVDTYSLADANTDTAADIQFAYALIQAYEKWEDVVYLNDALSMIDSIWQQEIFSSAGKLYIDSSADGSIDDRLINVTHFHPAAFRAFERLDQNPEHNWQKVIDDGYSLLAQLQSQYRNGLVPIHAIVKTNGTISNQTAITGLSTTRFDSSGVTLIHNLAADWQLTQEQRSYTILNGIARFFATEINGGNEIAGYYDLTSSDKDSLPNFAMQNGALIALVATGNQDAAHNLFDYAINAPLDRDTGVWGTEEDINSQLVGWQTYRLDIDQYITNRLEKE